MGCAVCSVFAQFIYCLFIVNLFSFLLIEYLQREPVSLFALIVFIAKIMIPPFLMPSSLCSSSKMSFCFSHLLFTLIYLFPLPFRLRACSTYHCGQRLQLQFYHFIACVRMK